MPFTHFSLCLQYVQAPMAQARSVCLVLSHPPALPRLASSRKCQLHTVVLRLWQEADQGWTNSFCYILGHLGLGA